MEHTDKAVEERKTARRRRFARRRRTAISLLAVLLAGTGTGVGFFVSSASPATALNTVYVTASSCAPGWVAPKSGDRVFELDNTTRSEIFGVDLVGANQLWVYGEIEMLAPGTTVAMQAVLPPGRYSFACESFSGATFYSASERVTGSMLSGAHPFIPPEVDQVEQATINYQNSLIPYLQRLETATEALTAAVQAGQLPEARTLWLPAHLDYARLGAAYDTFGNFNDEINGRPLGLQGGVHNPNWEGFLRLEYGLWHNQPVSELIPVTNRLNSDVHGLVRKFPSMQMPVDDLSLRTHEILENTLQFELTGETDEGSNTNLATAWANAQGTEIALQALSPLLHSLDPSLLATARSGVEAIAAEFKSYELPNGTWTPLQQLSTTQRERLDGSLGALLEQLSLIPDRLDLPIRPENPND